MGKLVKAGKGQRRERKRREGKRREGKGREEKGREENMPNHSLDVLQFSRRITRQGAESGRA